MPLSSRAAIVEREDAAKGGFWNVCSGTSTLREIAEESGVVRDCRVSFQIMVDVEDLRRNAFSARAQKSPKEFWSYIGWFYQLYTVDGTWVLKNLDNDKPDVATTPLRSFMKDSTAV